MKRSFKKCIREYGFLAERAMRMSEKAALRLSEGEQPADFERIAAMARAKSSLPDEAWAPVDRIIKRLKKTRSSLGIRIGGLTAAALVSVFAVLFVIFTPPGRAFADAARRTIEQAYEFVSQPKPQKTPEPVGNTPLHTAYQETDDPCGPTEASITPFTELTEEPGISPAPTPSPSRTPEPAPAATPVPPDAAAACCGEEGCYGAYSNGRPCCMKEGCVHICENNFPDPAIRRQLSLRYSDDNDETIIGKGKPEFGIMSFSGSVSTLRGLELIPGLTSLNAEGMTVFELDVTRITGLVKLFVKNSSAGMIDCSGLSALCDLVIEDSALNELRSSGCTGLRVFALERNDLKELDISIYPSLVEFRCIQSALEKLNVGYCPNLKKLEVRSCRLTSIDISGAANLYELYLNNNLLTSIKGLTDVPFYINISHNRLAAPIIERVIDREMPGFWNLGQQQIGVLTMTRTEDGYAVDLSGILKENKDRVRQVRGRSVYGDNVTGVYDEETGMAYFEVPLYDLKYYFFDNYSSSADIHADIELEENEDGEGALPFPPTHTAIIRKNDAD